MGSGWTVLYIYCAALVPDPSRVFHSPRLSPKPSPPLLLLELDDADHLRHFTAGKGSSESSLAAADHLRLRAAVAAAHHQDRVCAVRTCSSIRPDQVRPR